MLLKCIGRFQNIKSTFHSWGLQDKHLLDRIFITNFWKSDGLFGWWQLGLSPCPFFCHTAGRVNLPPVAVVSPERQELTLPLTSALIDGSRGYPAILQGVLPSALWDVMGGLYWGCEDLWANSPIDEHLSVSSSPSAPLAQLLCLRLNFPSVMSHLSMKKFFRV